MCSVKLFAWAGQLGYDIVLRIIFINPVDNVKNKNKLYTQETKQECIQWPNFGTIYQGVFSDHRRIGRWRLYQWVRFTYTGEVKQDISDNGGISQEKTMQ